MRTFIVDHSDLPTSLALYDFRQFFLGVTYTSYRSAGFFQEGSKETSLPARAYGA
jgi:hypothetical protein